MRTPDSWNHYAYRYAESGSVARVRFDVDRALQPSPSSHQRCVRVCVHGSVGDFEAQLLQILAEVDCCFVGVLAYAEITEFVLQVDDPVAFSAQEARLDHSTACTVRFDHSQGWDFFDDRICPGETDWRRITDREQLERLAAKGTDVRASRAVVHAFFGTHAQLERLAERIRPDGFEVVALEGQRLAVRLVHPLHEVSDLTVPLVRYAASLGVAYDGWTPEPTGPG
jgi:hypothetical protein